MATSTENPAAGHSGGARNADHVATLIASDNKPSRADPQGFCISDHFASPVPIATVVTASAFDLGGRHDDARDGDIGFAPPVFDYGALDTETAASIRATASSIRKRMKESVVATGRDLTEVKAKLEHGAFGRWLDAEFAMTVRTAQNYMRAADLADSKSETVSLLPATILFRLAAPSTPEAALDDVIARLVKQKMITEKRRWKRLSKEKEQVQQKLEVDRTLVEETAAREAVALLRIRLGDDFAKFVDLYDRAVFRFSPALRSAWHADQGREVGEGHQ